MAFEKSNHLTLKKEFESDYNLSWVAVDYVIYQSCSAGSLGCSVHTWEIIQVSSKARNVLYTSTEMQMWLLGQCIASIVFWSGFLSCVNVCLLDVWRLIIVSILLPSLLLYCDWVDYVAEKYWYFIVGCHVCSWLWFSDAPIMIFHGRFPFLFFKVIYFLFI